MCGICASIGKENQIKTVIDGLKKLEYRGYDSSGIAFLKKDKIKLVRSVGEIKNLHEKLQKKGILSDFEEKSNENLSIVIGHTRWATHGIVSEENAHPHVSASGRYAIVHNGIIENFEELKTHLSVPLKSQTDTEVFINLIEAQEGDTLTKMITACKQVIGSFAVAILDKKDKKIYLARRSSPLMVAQNQDCTMCASDMSVFAGKFDSCIVLEDDEFAMLDEKEVCFFDRTGKKLEKMSTLLGNFDLGEEKTESTYMQMEINQQANVLKKTHLQNLANAGDLDYTELTNFQSFHFVSCGTAYHSCLFGAMFVERFCNKPCKVSVASEFRYAKKPLLDDCLYIFVSQSGETADTIACAKQVKESGQKVLCVTNVPYSSLNKIADFILPTFAGKEVAVASTKAYTAQIFSLLTFAFRLAEHQKLTKNQQKTQENKNFQAMENFVSKFEITPLAPEICEEILKFKKIFFIGRGQDYVTSLEGALKLKEISYINCLGIPAGELKHGTLALVDEETLVIAISTQNELKAKVESNLQEIKARGGKVMLFSQFKPTIQVDYFEKLPAFEEYFMPIVSIVPLQQLALIVCEKLGFNPDKPRNLAKSVTVE